MPQAIIHNSEKALTQKTTPLVVNSDSVIVFQSINTQKRTSEKEHYGSSFCIWQIIVLSCRDNKPAFE